MLNIRRRWLPKQRKSWTTINLKGWFSLQIYLCCQGFNLRAVHGDSPQTKFLFKDLRYGSEIRLMIIKSKPQIFNSGTAFKLQHAENILNKQVLPLFNIAHYTLRTSCSQPGVSHSKLSFTNELRGFQTLWWQFVLRAEFFCHRDWFPKNAWELRFEKAVLFSAEWFSYGAMRWPASNEII